MKLNKDETEVKEKVEHSYRLGVIGTLGLFLGLVIPILINEDSADWLKLFQMPIFWSGIAFFLVFICLSIESALKKYWKYSTLKVFVAFVISIAVFIASSLADADINGVFGIDSSGLSYTFSIFTMVHLFVMLKPIFAFITILGSVLLIKRTYDALRYDGSGYLAYLFALGGVLGGGYPWYVIESYLNEDEMSMKIYKVAHMVDFKRKYSCSNIPKGKAVVFIGASQNRVLVDNPIQDFGTPKEFLYTKTSDHRFDIPDNFDVKKCQTK